MKIHPAVDADDPERVAKALASLWSSDAYPSSFGPGSWIVVAADDQLSAIQVRPRASAPQVAGDRLFTMTTRLSEAQVCAVAEAEGWPAARRCRGRFHVIEFGIENRVLIEILTPGMQAEQATADIPVQWRDMDDRRAA